MHVSDTVKLFYHVQKFKTPNYSFYSENIFIISTCKVAKDFSQCLLPHYEVYDTLFGPLEIHTERKNIKITYLNIAFNYKNFCFNNIQVIAEIKSLDVHGIFSTDRNKCTFLYSTPFIEDVEHSVEMQLTFIARILQK